MTPKELGRRIASATATDLFTGEQQQLVIGGRCHRFERFRIGAYDVELRLDWGDIDEHGFPRLDADFYDSVSGRPDKSMRAHKAHHTSSSGGQRLQCYTWEFESERRHIRIDLSWFASGTSTTESVGRGSASAANPA